MDISYAPVRLLQPRGILRQWSDPHRAKGASPLACLRAATALAASELLCWLQLVSIQVAGGKSGRSAANAEAEEIGWMDTGLHCALNDSHVNDSCVICRA